MKHPLKNFKITALATDVVIFTIKEEKLNVLLIKISRPPFNSLWAIPGGMVKLKETVDKAAERHLFAKTGVKDIYLEQLYTFGRVDRDPFGRVVSVAYFALIPNEGIDLKTTDEYSDISWYPVDKLPKMAYDHKEIIEFAVKRLQSKLEYTNIVYSLMPDEFSLTELQVAYEIILKKSMDKRNFRKKILGLKLIKPTGRKKIGEANRPAILYKFINKTAQIIETI